MRCIAACGSYGKLVRGKWAGDLTNLEQSDCYDATRVNITSMVIERFRGDILTLQIEIISRIWGSAQPGKFVNFAIFLLILG